MRAVVFDRYTTTNGLELREVPSPTPAPDRILVRVAAAGLNPFDWHMYRGEPWMLRLSEGWRVSQPRIAGADLAGVVVDGGDGTHGLAAGDHVFGSIGLGALGEVASVDPQRLARIDPALSLIEAAATPMAALTALQALRDAGGTTEGDRVLVWGASGGVGHLAVPLARHLGAIRVDGMSSAASGGFVRGLGVDAAYDRRGDLPPGAGPYDVVVDTAATQPLRRLRRLLAPSGRVVTVGSVSRGRAVGPAGAFVSRTVSGRLSGVATRGVFAAVRAGDLAAIAELLAAGTIRPSLQEVFPLTRFREAFSTLETGAVRGKLVVQIADS